MRVPVCTHTSYVYTLHVCALVYMYVLYDTLTRYHAPCTFTCNISHTHTNTYTHTHTNTPAHTHSQMASNAEE